MSSSRGTFVLAACAAATALAACQGSGQSAKPEEKKVVAAPSSASRLDPSRVVLSWSGGQMTYGELQEKKAATFNKLRNKYLSDLYSAEQEELEGFIVQKLVQEKAKAAGKTEEQYVQELAGQATVTEEEVKAFYDKNVAQSGQPFEAIRDRIRPYLEQQKKQESMRAAFEKLKAEANVKIDLPPPDMTKAEFQLAGRPMKGKPDAKVTIVEFSDFQCPYCSRAVDGVEKILEAYPNDVKVYFLHYPLKFHEAAMPAAIASACAHQQDKFWPFHDRLFQNQQNLTSDLYKSSAKDLGLDESKFVACLDDPSVKDLVTKDMEMGDRAGVEGTPSFFINGVPYAQGVPTVDAIKPYVEKAN